MDKAEIKNEMKYVTEGNILKRAAAEKREEINLISSEIQKLELKRQKLLKLYKHELSIAKLSMVRLDLSKKISMNRLDFP